MSDEGSYTTCPYNSKHRVRTIRMPAHIVKCEKSYRGPALEQCRYNATHLLPLDQLQQHEFQCSDCHRFHGADFLKIAQQHRTQ